MKLLRKSLSFAVILCVMLQMFVFSASAATNRVTVSVNNKNPLVGQTITVKIVPYTTETDGLGAISDAKLTYNASVLKLKSYGSEAKPDPNKSGQINFYYVATKKGSASVTFTLTFQVIKEGSSTIKFTGDLANWTMDSVKPISDDETIKATDKSKLPSDATLKSLKLSAGTLSPAFKASVTSYTVTVPYDTTKVLVTAVTNDSKATSSVSGSSTMKVGKNTRIVTVTAQNGSTKKYTIVITRQPDPNASTTPDEPDTPENPTINPYEIVIGDQSWTLLNDYNLITPPNGYEIASTLINETDIPVLVHKDNGTVLVYAVNDTTGAGEYFVYDAQNSSYSDYKFFVIDSATYTIWETKNPKPAPEGFMLKDIEVMGYTIPAYVYNDSAYSDYVIFYAESSNGVKTYYRYDRSDNTVQKATDFMVALGMVGSQTTVVANGNIIENFMALPLEEQLIVYAVIAIVVLIIILVILNIVKLCSGKKKNKKEKSEFEYNSTAENTDFSVEQIDDNYPQE